MKKHKFSGSSNCIKFSCSQIAYIFFSINKVYKVFTQENFYIVN